MDNRVIGTMIRASAFFGSLHRAVGWMPPTGGRAPRTKAEPYLGKLNKPGPYSGVKKHMRYLRRKG